ncbi:YCF48-related protein [Marinobacter salarius]|uniref:YCF48-related protein n=1 Tax=Marinobacter salarius TaxID=1420917 RepID=UPI001D18F904|nr:YCF48-related protein [Marinobacter salarius]MCC4284842.1 YCF48-related protein [Marinobacter salarius]
MKSVSEKSLYRAVFGLIISVLTITGAQAGLGSSNSVDWRPSLMVKSPENVALLDLVRHDGRLIALGERGVIILSEDEGQSWTQADVPVDVSLTAIEFVDENTGWAVGHRGVLLKSTNGGRSWQFQRDGAYFAKLAMKSFEQSGIDDPYRKQSYEYLVQDGADKPLLDVRFLNPDEGYVIGSYGLAFRTTDGGISWHSVMERIDNPSKFHLNTIVETEEHLLIVGEMGGVYLSDKARPDFRLVEDIPYEGSYFVAETISGERVVIGGLQGHVFIYDLTSDEWTEVTIPEVENGITHLTHAGNGIVWIASLDGLIARYDIHSRTYELMNQVAPMLTAILELPGNTLGLTSLHGYTEATYR